MECMAYIIVYIVYKGCEVHLVHVLIVAMVGLGTQQIKWGLALCWNVKLQQGEMEGGLSVSSDWLWVPLHCPL